MGLAPVIVNRFSGFDFALVIQTGSVTPVTKHEYLHRDHIGSIVAISKGSIASANDVQWQANGAWGERRYDHWNGPLDNMLIPASTAKGFTDHEHLDAVGLIHMNGRVYDPELGRFMSADPFVQAPYNSQSYNRYSYVFNNPLSYTNPSGFTTDCNNQNAGIGHAPGGDCVEETTTYGDKAAYEEQRKQDAIAQWNYEGWSNWASRQNIMAGATAGMLYNQALWNGGATVWNGHIVLVGGVTMSGGDIVVRNSQSTVEFPDGNIAMGIAPDPKLIVLALAAGGAKLARFARSQTHGNSKSSSKSQHIYSITDTRTGAIYKFGISGSKLNQDGTSRRANSQVNLLNRTEGAGTFKASVLMTNIPNRFSALAIEKTLVYGYLATTGDKPAGNQRP